MSDPQTPQDQQTTLIRGLLQALVVRRQQHGLSGLSYEQHTDETYLVGLARAYVLEQERRNGLPLDPWDPRYRS